jgi:hypothetical protein
MVEQAIRFAPLFGDDLVEGAVLFAGDEMAIIRNLSVLLWRELIQGDRERAVAVARLAEGRWQVRMVAAKIIGELGVIGGLEESAALLARDPVPNVRYCLAAALVDTEWYREVFASSDDPELLNIKFEA